MKEVFLLLAFLGSIFAARLPNAKPGPLSAQELEEYLKQLLEESFQQPEEFTNLYSGECSFSIKDLSNKLPVVLTNSKLTIPDGTTGNISFKTSDEIVVSCQGNGNYLIYDNVSKKNQQDTLTCKDGKLKPASHDKSVSLEDISCQMRVTIEQEYRGSRQSCGKSGKIIDVAVLTSDASHIVYSSCFDEKRSDVLWVKNELTPENFITQSRDSGISFLAGSFFQGLKMDELYNIKGQQQAFYETLGKNSYVTTTNSLNRGHYAARADFVLAPQQKASYTYVNTAPQWKLFNGGNWGVLEVNLREKVKDDDVRTEVYTGTWKVLQLKDDSGRYQDIYLSPSSGRLPVPLWFYRVVYEPKTKRGIAFLGLNNPTVDLAEAKQMLQDICDDKCTDSAMTPWLKWKKTDILKGFSGCCDVNDFQNTVTNLPPLKTTGKLLFF